MRSSRSAAACGALLSLLSTTAWLSACATAAEKTEKPVAEAPADAGAVVRELSAKWWEMLMERSPEWATAVGDHRYDDRLSARGPAARAAWRARLSAFHDEVEARARSIDRAALKDSSAVTLELLRREVREALVGEDLGFATFEVDQMGGPQASLPYFFSVEHPMETRADVENLLARYHAVPAHLDGLTADLEEGLAGDRTAPRVVTERVIKQLDALLAAPAGVFVRVQDRVPESLPAAEREAAQRAIREAAETEVRPAFERYRAFLKERYLPRARDDVGLSAMPGGKAAYAHLAAHYTTTTLTPEQIHEIGLKELARIEVEMAKLAKERGHRGDVKSFLASLREDRSQYAQSREELLDTFRVALARADAKLPAAFGRLPKLPYRVEPLDAAREQDAPAAYYQPGSVQDARPGIFVANLHRFEERPVFNSEVLAFHEAVPGHHLQISIAQELAGLPRFRAEGGFTAFVEGWGLYSERLSDELGLYSSLEARVGYLGFAAWRASRLVVDTGMHHLGWTREQAIEFLGAHTTLGPVDVENEIDRYIAWPGQALAYMVGCLRILEIREHARSELGERFDLRAFHDALLGGGALPLDLLDDHVARALSISPLPG